MTGSFDFGSRMLLPVRTFKNSQTSTIELKYTSSTEYAKSQRRTRDIKYDGHQQNGIATIDTKLGLSPVYKFTLAPIMAEPKE